MADERLREAERRWRASGEDADGLDYLAEKIRFEPDILPRILRHMIRLERALLRVGNANAGPAATPIEDVLTWIETGSAPEPLLERMTPRQAFPPGESQALEMNRGYSPAWLAVACVACSHDRGYHGQPLDTRGECLVRGCRLCTRFLAPPPAPARRR